MRYTLDQAAERLRWNRKDLERKIKHGVIHGRNIGTAYAPYYLLEEETLAEFEKKIGQGIFVREEETV